jgi:hypothetical protein
MRRWVRSPVSRYTTAPISSSVWRLPFISASALPCAHHLDGPGGRSVAVRGVNTFIRREAQLTLLCHGGNFRLWTDQDGPDEPHLRRLGRITGVKDGSSQVP